MQMKKYITINYSKNTRLFCSVKPMSNYSAQCSQYLSQIELVKFTIFYNIGIIEHIIFRLNIKDLILRPYFNTFTQVMQILND